MLTKQQQPRSSSAGFSNFVVKNFGFSRYFSYLGLALFLVFTLLAGLAFGAVDISFSQVLDALTPELATTANLDSNQQTIIERIIWELRFPRLILAFLAGAGLAIAGLVLQTVTRNPLADPYLFGVSSGASFGVVVLLTVFGTSIAGTATSLPVAAFIGSLIAMFFMLIIAGQNHRQQVESMLLTGVALTFMFSAFTSLLLYLTDPQAVSAILFWTLGSFSRAQWSQLSLPAVIISISLVLVLSQRRQLNAMILGDESATTLGIKVKQFRLQMLLVSSLITATLVAICGGIGFVGLMVPHIVRYFIATGTYLGLSFTALVGGIFMVWVDIISRNLLSNQELPIGIITSAIGSLFFLTLLYFRKNKP